MRARVRSRTCVARADSPSDGKLLVFEINRRFFRLPAAKYFRSAHGSYQFESVEDLESELQRRGFERVDAVVSSLGLAFMPDRQRHALFQQLSPFLHQRSVFTQYQYIHGMQFVNGRLRRLDLRPLLERYFGAVQCRIVWRNLPPAFVFTCHTQTLPRQSPAFSCSPGS